MVKKLLLAAPLCAVACGHQSLIRPAEPLPAQSETTTATPPAAPADLSRTLTLAVPTTTSAMIIDGNADETDWQDAVRTGGFIDDVTHNEARPFSEVLFLADAGHLYFLFYAADQKIQLPASPLADQPLEANDHFDLFIRSV